MHINDNFKYKDIRQMNVEDDVEMGFWLIESSLNRVRELFKREDIQKMVKDVLVDVKAIEEIYLSIIRKK